MEILPTVTTTTIFDWENKIKEIKDFGLEKIALFPTCLNFEAREKLYNLLKDTKVKNIPFVHLRSDITKEEIDYLIKNYNTQIFNMHTKREYPYPPDCQKYKNMIYIENTYYPFDEKELEQFAGICLDFAHLENSKIFKPDTHGHNVKLIEKYGCGCNHISPDKNYSLFNKTKRYQGKTHAHFLEKLSQLNYLKSYPQNYFGRFAALEMENSIKEQLEAKDYILKILKFI